MKTLPSNLLIVLASVMAGIVCSSWLHGITITLENYMATLVLSPFVLTLGLPIGLAHGNVWIGRVSVAGFVGIIVCVFCGGLMKKQIGWRVAIALCSLLWSLGSAFTMAAWSGI